MGGPRKRRHPPATPRIRVPPSPRPGGGRCTRRAAPWRGEGAGQGERLVRGGSGPGGGRGCSHRAVPARCWRRCAATTTHTQGGLPKSRVGVPGCEGEWPRPGRSTHDTHSTRTSTARCSGDDPRPCSRSLQANATSGRGTAADAVAAVRWVAMALVGRGEGGAPRASAAVDHCPSLPSSSSASASVSASPPALLPVFSAAEPRAAAASAASD